MVTYAYNFERQSVICDFKKKGEEKKVSPVTHLARYRQGVVGG
jgi:hypothetical protein